MRRGEPKVGAKKKNKKKTNGDDHKSVMSFESTDSPNLQIPETPKFPNLQIPESPIP
jgi:hypothetical protein